MQLNKIQKNIITVRGRERSLTIKQKNLFANLEKYKLDFSLLHNDKNNKELFIKIRGFLAEINFFNNKDLPSKNSSKDKEFNPKWL